MLGRIVGVLVAISGTFILSMIFVFLVLYITLDKDENNVSYFNIFKAYRKINYLHKKKDVSDDFNEYINSYIKYKFIKNRNGRLLEAVKLRNKYQVLKSKHFYSFFNDNKDMQGSVLQNFSTKLNDYWNEKIDNIFYSLGSSVEELHNTFSEITSKSNDLYKLTYISGVTSFRCHNLMNFIDKAGFSVKINNLNDIQGKKLVNTKEIIGLLENFKQRHVKDLKTIANSKFMSDDNSFSDIKLKKKIVLKPENFTNEEVKIFNLSEKNIVDANFINNESNLNNNRKKHEKESKLSTINLTNTIRNFYNLKQESTKNMNRVNNHTSMKLFEFDYNIEKEKLKEKEKENDNIKKVSYLIDKVVELENIQNEIVNEESILLNSPIKSKNKNPVKKISSRLILRLENKHNSKYYKKKSNNNDEELFDNESENVEANPKS